MNPNAARWLADENFPIPAYNLLCQAGWDVVHVGLTEPGIPDTEVLERAIAKNRIVITFDNDHGTLVFRDGFRPTGVVHFRLLDYLPDVPARMLIELEAAG
jgi:predicted nuclease of predicted toxin-antitoxin system